MKPYILELDIYPSQVIVAIDCPVEDVIALLKSGAKIPGSICTKEHIDAIERDLSNMELSGGRALLFEGGNSLIYIPSKIKTIEDIGLVLHEIDHVRFHILDNVGIELGHRSEEAFTYLYQYLCVQIIDSIAESKAGGILKLKAAS